MTLVSLLSESDSSSEVEIISLSTPTSLPVSLPLPIITHTARPPTTVVKKPVTAPKAKRAIRTTPLSTTSRPSPAIASSSSAVSTSALKGKGKAVVTVDVVVVAPKRLQVADDEVDDFFTRRPSVTKVTRKPGGGSKKLIVAPPPPSSSNDSSGSASEDSAAECVIGGLSDSSTEAIKQQKKGKLPLKRKRGRALKDDAAQAPLDLPDWTRQGLSPPPQKAVKNESKKAKRARLLGLPPPSESEESDDGTGRGGAMAGSESEVDSLAGSSDSEVIRKKERRQRIVEKKKVVKRMKSRSLTPPSLEAQYAVAMQVRALKYSAQVRNGSFDAAYALPTSIVSAQDPTLEALDPQLAAIAAALETKRVNRFDVGGGTELVNITLTMIPDPSPPTPMLALDRRRYETPYHLVCQRGASFSDLFQLVSRTHGIAPDNLVFIYNTSRVYSYGTPASLRLYGDAHFQGYHKLVYEKIQAIKVATASTATRTTDLDLDVGVNEVDGRVGGEEEAEEIATVAQAGDLFRITIRGPLGATLPLAVKRTTLVSTLLKQYCKHFKVADMTKAWLEFDGEKLNLGDRIGEGEVEDEETIDFKQSKV